MRFFLSKFFAFLRKDIQTTLSYKFNLLLQIIFIIFIISLIFFSAIPSNDAGNGNSEFFKILVGIALIDFMFSSMSVFSREVRLAQMHGTFEALILTKTSILTILLSSYALTFSRSFFRMLIYVFISKFIFGVDITLSNIPIFFTLVVYNCIPFIGVGLFAAAFIILFKVGNVISFFVAIPSIFFSGIFFSLDAMPEYLVVISNNLPLSIGLDIAEQALLSDFDLGEAFPDLLKILCMSLLFVPTGILLVYYSLKEAKKNGNLNHY
ncbi:MAG: hypothetical protein CMD12_00660 [Flavobacteriales bacterium]|nr:hypothetical protein [Flavobacteriales bacterium]|tara:strand:- start:1992 stop:2789 length:798 start_codon:yes stop_codon:yes gene_type:complete